MKLVHPILSQPISLLEDRVAVLAVENPVCMRHLITEIVRQLSGEDGDFILSEDQKILSFGSVVELVLDPFRLDINQRRLLNRVYSDVARLAVGEDYYTEGQTIRSEILAFLLKLSAESEFTISFDEDFAWESLLKAVNLKIETVGQSLLECIMDYMKAVELMTSIRLVIFVNLQSYFSQVEIESLEQFSKYDKLNMIRIEGGKWDHNLRSEDVVIIDEDLCEIRR